ncbi:hypothetical protein HDV03_002398 [Kappamyces sp. JEL0829]|nr:hypothetical protein HDV03_002398 [Kappamyces sp. JEL0829]
MSLLASFRRSFSSSGRQLGLFKNYVNALKAAGVQEIDAKGLHSIMTKDSVHGAPENFHLLDVRETFEWNEDHIPYATYTGRGNLERDIVRPAV